MNKVSLCSATERTVAARVRVHAEARQQKRMALRRTYAKTRAAAQCATAAKLRHKAEQEKESLSYSALVAGYEMVSDRSGSAKDAAKNAIDNLLADVIPAPSPGSSPPVPAELPRIPSASSLERYSQRCSFRLTYIMDIGSIV